MNRAADCSDSRQWRACADAFLEIYRFVGNADCKSSYWALHGFTTCFTDKAKGVRATETDLSFLSGFVYVDDDGTFVEQRMHAGYALGVLYRLDSRNHECIKLCRRMLKLVLPESERGRKVEDSKQAASTAGALFDRQKWCVQDLLKEMLSAGALPISFLSTDLTGEPIAVPGSIGDGVVHCLKVGAVRPPGLTQAVAETYIRMSSRITGAACDRCGIPSPAGGKRFTSCSVCSRKAYCSAKCQKEDWKASHKVSCRAPKDFKSNDLVRIYGFDKNTSLNGQIVMIVARVFDMSSTEVAGMDQVKWAVSYIGDHDLSSMPGVNLILVVPAEERVDLVE